MDWPSVGASHVVERVLAANERVASAVRRARRLIDHTSDPHGEQPTALLTRYAAVETTSRELLVAAASLHTRAAAIHDGTATSLMRAAQLHRETAKLDVPRAARHLDCAEACQRAAEREQEHATAARQAAVLANQRHGRVKDLSGAALPDRHQDFR